MPVTIRPVNHAARRWPATNAVYSADDLLKDACPKEHKKCKWIIQSSFTKFGAESPLYPSANGFVRAAIAAYCDHQHLTLRPEDIWFAILTQLSLFINAHAEELRSFFVPHQGQKELEIYAFGTIHTVDFGRLAEKMTVLMNENVVDPELQSWVMPAFSTTTETDKAVAAVIMMGAMQKYFSYVMHLMCGIPSVTLLGVRADWQLMLERLEKLPNLGGEATQFYKLLKPVLTRFVTSFDAPDSAETKDFWQKIAHKSGGSGPRRISGWIVAFCFWDEDGKSLYAPRGTPPSGAVDTRRGSVGCCLDNTLYHRVNMNDIPAGYSSVPVKVDDNGTWYDTTMVAGSLGIRVSSTNEPLDQGPSYFYHAPLLDAQAQSDTGLDSLQPECGWFMYERLAEPGGEKVIAGGGQLGYQPEASTEQLQTQNSKGQVIA